MCERMNPGTVQRGFVQLLASYVPETERAGKVRVAAWVHRRTAARVLHVAKARQNSVRPNRGGVARDFGELKKGFSTRAASTRKGRGRLAFGEKGGGLPRAPTLRPRWLDPCQFTSGRLGRFCPVGANGSQGYPGATKPRARPRRASSHPPGFSGVKSLFRHVPRASFPWEFSGSLLGPFRV